MPRKKSTDQPPAPATRRSAPKTAKAAKPAATKPCVVCGAEVAPFSTEDLCWVCRRLKISAWRDADTQSPAAE